MTKQIILVLIAANAQESGRILLVKGRQTIQQLGENIEFSISNFF